MSNKCLQLNVLGGPLTTCSQDPMTGFFRTGCCEADDRDYGKHFVCAQITSEFLKFSLEKGNDLISPVPEFNFPGLKENDKWCLCLDRWIEALKNDVAPKLLLQSTNRLVLKKISLGTLKKFAIDLN